VRQHDRGALVAKYGRPTIIQGPRSPGWTGTGGDNIDFYDLGLGRLVEVIYMPNAGVGKGH